ncbi:MAG: energy transducer TonB [Gemmatimonadota bacterium]|nr:MAG: energy transducer TonB [Gemmatimonadota bacterium]
MEAENLTEERQADEKRITFELVETPEESRSEKAPDHADLISDKNSIARDQNQNEDRPSEDPYSKGDLDVKEIITSQPETPSSSSPSSIPGSETEAAQAGKNAGSSPTPTGLGQSPLSIRQFLARITPSQNTQHKNQSPDRPLYDHEISQAEDYGGLTFNTYNWDFAPYLIEMKRKIENNMYPPPAFTRFGFIQGETLIRFRVMPSGEVTDLVVLNHNGHESLKTTSQQAILLSSAFTPLPKDFPEDYLEVTCSFKYVVLR